MKKSTEVATQAKSSVVPFNRSALSQGIAAAKEISPPGNSTADIMKVTPDEKIVMGIDQEEVSETEEWIISPGLIYLGWICWKNGKPVDTKHRSLVELATNDAYVQDDLPDHGPYTSEMDGWSEQSVMGMVSKQDGLKTVFPSTSYGGRQAIQSVIDSIGEQDGSGSDYMYPVITVTADSYFNKKFKKDIAFPVFTIVRWENELGEAEA